MQKLKNQTKTLQKISLKRIIKRLPFFKTTELKLLEVFKKIKHNKLLNKKYLNSSVILLNRIHQLKILKVTKITL